jgi:TetR/AcrR family transcriptional regulator
MTRTGGEERRRKLVAEAIGAFGARGYEATTLDSVAEAAGVRRQTLLYYFPAKEELFEACVDELSGRVAEALERALERLDRGGDPTEQVIHAIFRLAEEWPDFPGFVREASRRGPEVVQRFAGVLDPLRKRALEFLERGMDAGRFRRQDPTLLLFMIYTAAAGPPSAGASKS